MKPAGHPVGGVDYPRTFEEFDAWFGNEAACRRYLAHLRWPSGFTCPHCGAAGKAWTTKRELFHCATCEGQTSVIAGTIFQGTRKPLRLWFLAMWFVTSQKHGANAMGLQRVLGLGSYETAWAWLHKLRRPMVRPGRDRLQGTVEVDESYVGGEEEGAIGRYTKTKAIVAIAVEIHSPKGFGRVRIQRVSGVSAADLTPFVRAAIEPGSIVHTDGWKGYNEITKHGYQRKATVISASGDPAHVALPGVHWVAALLKRWLLGTHQGAVSNKHLDYYLDECTFRFNRRTAHTRGLLFHRLAEQAIATPPVTYRGIVTGEGSAAAQKLLE